MQNGHFFGGALLGKSYIKWGAKADRKPGEMLILFICPKSASLDVKPEEIMVSSENITQVESRLLTMKQFDTIFIQVEKQREQLIFKNFIDLK